MIRKPRERCRSAESLAEKFLFTGRTSSDWVTRGGIVCAMAGS